MGLGYQGSFGVSGLYDSLDHLLAQRTAARMYQDKLKQQEIENAMRTRQMDETSAFRQQQMQSEAADQQQSRAHQLVTEMSPNQSIDAPTAGVLRSTGRGSLVTENPRPAGEGFVLPNSQEFQPGSQPGMIFTGTAQQRDQVADNDQQRRSFDANERYRSGELDRQNARDAELIRHNKAEEDLQRQAANAKNAPKPAGPPSPYMQERNQRTLQSVDELMGKVGAGNTGLGSLLANIPGTDARNFAAELNTLKANIGFGELTAMREASKTGGALGQVSDRELNLLTSALGALDAGQSPANLKAQLQKIKESLTRWNAAQAQSGGAGPAPNAAAPKKPTAAELIKKYGG